MKRAQSLLRLARRERDVFRRLSAKRGFGAFLLRRESADSLEAVARRGIEREALAAAVLDVKPISVEAQIGAPAPERQRPGELGERRIVLPQNAARRRDIIPPERADAPHEAHALARTEEHLALRLARDAPDGGRSGRKVDHRVLGERRVRAVVVEREDAHLPAVNVGEARVALIVARIFERHAARNVSDAAPLGDRRVVVVPHMKMRGEPRPDLRILMDEPPPARRVVGLIEIRVECAAVERRRAPEPAPGGGRVRDDHRRCAGMRADLILDPSELPVARVYGVDRAHRLARLTLDCDEYEKYAADKFCAPRIAPERLAVFGDRRVVVVIMRKALDVVIAEDRVVRAAERAHKLAQVAKPAARSEPLSGVIAREHRKVRVKRGDAPKLGDDVLAFILAVLQIADKRYSHALALRRFSGICPHPRCHMWFIQRFT